MVIGRVIGVLVAALIFLMFLFLLFWVLSSVKSWLV